MRRKECVPKVPGIRKEGGTMAKRGARRKVSFLLATTFAVGTGPAVIGAMAKDETPSCRERRQGPGHSARHDHRREQAARSPAPGPRRRTRRSASRRGAARHHQCRRRRRLSRQQHVDCDQDQHTAARHPAGGHRHHQAAGAGHRRAADRGRRALRSRRQLAPGRRQSRSARHSRAEFDRRFLRQRHARRRAVSIATSTTPSGSNSSRARTR